MRREIALWRVVVIYLLGVFTGVQGALYMYDTWDDGVSSPWSGLIATAFLVASVSIIIATFRGRR
ncbi:MAG TPA: hypothetical protein VGD49_05195 [Longimicrobiales bacterium]